MSRSKPQRAQHASAPLRSYLLRIVQQRVLSVSTVYELHDIVSGKRLVFDSLVGLQQFLSRQRRPARR